MNENQIKNIVGTKIGLYEILYECDFKSKDGHRMFHIRCSECGWETNTQKHQIKFLSNKCTHRNKAGQYSKESAKLLWKNKRIQRIYQGLLNRCYNEKSKSYRWYGAKGIKVCKEWLDNPLEFEQWALSNGYKDNLTIDRKNSNKDYCPKNCRWVTNIENSKYKLTTKILEVDGIEHTGREWGNLLNLGTNTINKMLREHPKEIVQEFIRRRKKNKTLKRKSHQTWLNVYNII